VDAWTGAGDGWFRAPRTLPLLFLLLRSKRLSGKKDPSRVYMALLARHVDSGLVEVTNEAELAYESGYTGQRAVRTWQERMLLLQELGLIRIRPSGNQKYRYVVLSEGIHHRPDDECLEIFDRCKAAFEYVFRELQVQIEDARAYMTSLGAIGVKK